MAQLIVNGTTSEWACWRCSQPRYSFDWRSLHPMSHPKTKIRQIFCSNRWGIFLKLASQRTVDSFVTRQPSWYLGSKLLSNIFFFRERFRHFPRRPRFSQVSGCPSSTTCGLLILIDDFRDLGYRCMLTVLICDLRNSALNVALGQLIIAGAVCVPRKNTFL